ncbi:MAG: uroporphyrinogen-III C-methyltransferase [Legionella sp.]|nr:uroporphyrinogen-III C-methyltransferase [Legionella sp.]
MTQNKQDDIQEKTKPNKPKGPTKATYKWVIIGLILISILFSVFFALHYFQKMRNEQQQLLHSNNQFIGQLEQLKQEQSLIKSTIEDNQATLQSSLEHLKTQSSKSTAPNMQDWQLLKVRFYLELAQINAHWGKDYNTTLALLEAADGLLSQINQVKIYELRQILAKEMTDLKAIPKVDMTGLLSQLDAVQSALSTLNMQYLVNKHKSYIQPTSNPSSQWRARLKESFSSLDKLVIIRRDDEEIKSFMSPFFKKIIKETIALNLQEAQWAVINLNDGVFQLALKQAISHLEKTSDSQDAKTSALISQLKTLQQRQLASPKLSIGSGLPLLNQLIDDKKTNTEPAGNQGASSS